ncbi:restriction endonuclease [Streptomyces sp. NPDC058964]|uniref:restriction endonuclease n=1 Tax=Streptomyces sp. NPDC058964 TaxID=3346681 RepID=UPI0036C94472
MGRTGFRVRRPRGRTEQLAAGAVVAAVGWALTRAVVVAGQAVVRWWPALAVVAAVFAGWGLWRAVQAGRRRREQARRLARLRLTLAELDVLGDREFEYALRDLLIRDGWTARQVGRAGDQSADVIAEHTRYGRLVVQAKHTRVGGRVGSSVMYQLKGTAGPAHGAHAAVVVTNGHVTRDAKEWGRRHRIGWVDRDRLARWAQDGIPLDQLLRLPPSLRRRAGLRTATAVGEGHR